MTQSNDNGNKTTTMKALVFHGPNSLALEDKAKPTVPISYFSAFIFATSPFAVSSPVTHYWS